MRVAAHVCSCCNIGLLLRGVGHLAIEDQNFTQSDQQRYNESEPSVGFHECLRECRPLVLLNELYQCPVERVLRLPVHSISKKMLLACILLNPVVASIPPQANASAALATSKESAAIPRIARSPLMSSDSAPMSNPRRARG